MSDEDKIISADKIIKEVSPVNNKAPLMEYKLVYDSSVETLEPVYFWLLDFLQPLMDVVKIKDNFVASPGSGYFSEIGARATKMQEEGMKILGAVNIVVKSIIQLLYDLKEFEIRIKHYDNAEKKETMEEGMLALKQIWMDNVDVKRGMGSINRMTYELGFATLRDAFMSVNSVDDVKRMDLNDRVKRVLEPRIAEFQEWIKRSKSELKRRFEIERTYLRSQISTLKLYSRWVKPYLKAAEELSMRKVEDSRQPWIVNAFNTMVLELSLFCSKAISVESSVYDKLLPPEFKKMDDRKKIRKTYAILLVDFAFRGIPRRVPESHYVHGGRAEVYFRAYTLNEDEKIMFEHKMDQSDIAAALGLANDITEESLKQMIEDIKYFLEKGDIEEKKEKKEPQSNPFTALVSAFVEPFLPKKKEPAEEGETKEEKELKKLKEMIAGLKQGIAPDSYEERTVRKIAQKNAIDMCFKLNDKYKKAHGMAAFPTPPKFEMFYSKNPYF